MLLERLAHEGLVRVEHRRPVNHPRPEKPLGLDRPPDGVVMDAKLAGDRADAPVLGEEEAADAGPKLGRDHRAASRRRARAEPALALGAAGAGERVVADVPAGRAAPGAAGVPRPGPQVIGGMGNDLRRGLRLRGARRRRGAHHRGRWRVLATVMRHFRATALAVSPLAHGVRRPPVEAPLVSLPGGAEGRPARRARAGGSAVAVAPVAAHAEEEDLPARRPRAGHEPQGLQAPSARAGTGPATSRVRSPCCWIAGALPEPAEGSER